MTALGSQCDRIVVVLSSGRTGTTAFARIMNEGFEGVHAVHEPWPSRHLRMASFARLAGRLSDDRLTTLLTRARRRRVGRVAARIYVESNPYLVGFLDVLGRVFPDPLVLHIVRDARAVVASALNFGVQRGVKWLFSSFVPHWIIKPEQLDADAERTWARMSPVERFAWFWRIINEHLERGARLYGADYRRVRFEDLYRPDGGGFRELGAWIGAVERPGRLEPLLAERVNRSTGRVMPTWPQWEPADRAALLAQCGALMERYGYPTAPDANTSPSGRDPAPR